MSGQVPPNDEDSRYQKQNEATQGVKDAAALKKEQAWRTSLSGHLAAGSASLFIVGASIAFIFYQYPVDPPPIEDVRWVILDKYFFRSLAIGTCAWAALSLKNSAERLSFPPHSRQATQGLRGSDESVIRKFVNYWTGRF